MNRKKELRLKSWSLVLILTFLIYSTLYIAPSIFSFFGSLMPMEFVSNIVMFVILWVLVIMFLLHFEVRQKGTYVLLALFSLFYMYGVIFWVKLPAEKMHLIEYSLLSMLIYRALFIDCEASSSYLLAFLLTALIGWGDEGIQYLLPNRYYELRDVILNIVSGGMGLFLVFIFRKEISSNEKYHL